MRSQRHTNANKVEKGRAVDEACAQVNILRTKMNANDKPGKSKAVYRALVFWLMRCRKTYHDCVLLRILSAKGLVYPRREVSRAEPSDDE
jgi:hypothetical protein